MDAEQYALLRKVNKRLLEFLENGSAKILDAGGLDGPLNALVDTVNRLVTGGADKDRMLSEEDFIEAGRNELTRATRYGRQLSVLAVELDRYEATLTEHGAEVATEVRATAKRLLNSVLRESDLFGQRSETRFGVILPETEGDIAVEVGERLRAAFEAEDVFTGDELIVLTVSIGAAGAISTDTTFDTTCHRAVDAMSEASRAGGNQVTGCHLEK